MRLLPRNELLAWTPYVWLIYLAIFFVEPVMHTRAGRGSAWEWAATALGTAVFLATYFRGHWLRDRRLLPVVGVLLALGAGFAPFNSGSSIFFVYAVSFAGQLERPREAVGLVALVVLAAAATAWLAHAPLYFWLGGVAFSVILGAVTVHYAQVGLAGMQLRLAQEEVRHLAAVAERERIARDLHDVLGHTLSLIVLKSELASVLAEADPPRAAREIRDVEQVARTALREVREAIAGYRATLDDEAARARSLLGAAGVRADVTLSPPPMPRALEEVLALALREAVTNVVRHAAASVCRARVRAHDGACLLEVEDDGRGGAHAPEGSGLRGMRERVELAGGRVARTAARGGRGTRLVVTLPLASAERASVDAAGREDAHEDEPLRSDARPVVARA